MTEETPYKNKKIEVLENLINEYQTRSEQNDQIFQNTMEKMAKIEAHLQKAIERRETADKRVQELESDLRAAATCLKQAGQQKTASAKKEKEQQDQISSLEESIVGFETRATAAEQNIDKLERLTEGVLSEYDSVHSQREAVEEEQEKACQEN